MAYSHAGPISPAREHLVSHGNKAALGSEPVNRWRLSSTSTFDGIARVRRDALLFGSLTISRPFIIAVRVTATAIAPRNGSPSRCRSPSTSASPLAVSGEQHGQAKVLWHMSGEGLDLG